MTTLSTGSVTQYAVLDALLAGAYGTGIPAPEVRGLGDFGIGCCEGLGGEVILVDGHLVECTVDGPPRTMTESETLPFFEVCTFPAVAPSTVREAGHEELLSRIEEHVLSRNLFHAVRLDGLFRSVTVRVPPRASGFPVPLAEIAQRQIETRVSDARGTLVGFWVPEIYQGIAVAGAHLHFLSDDHQLGGHVLDVGVEDAELRIAAFARFDLRLPTDEVFLSTPLTHDDDHRIIAVESASPR
ncbi:acetolactate decarboxylase [Microbacterium sp. RD1]|uniref:acetolactate decarboxylase n=1 Tax=Microbacterium sp. RD1 TaxID=3457313 RepID=UPI003FA5D341